MLKHSLHVESVTIPILVIKCHMSTQFHVTACTNIGSKTCFLAHDGCPSAGWLQLPLQSDPLCVCCEIDVCCVNPKGVLDLNIDACVVYQVAHLTD